MKRETIRIYGLAGVITFTVEGKAVDISPGEYYFIPGVRCPSDRK